MFARFFIFLILLSFSVVTQAQQYDWSQYKDRIGKIIRTPGMFEASVDRLGVKGQARPVMVEYFRELYATDEMLDYLVDQIRLGKMTNPPKGADPFRFGQAFGTELATSLSMKGLSRLSAEDQRRVMEILYEFYQVIPAADCKKAFTEDNATFDEFKYYDKIEPETLKEHLALLKKAMFAEIRDNPKRKVISEKQSEAAEEAFAGAFQRIVRKDKVSDAVLEAIDNMEAADPKIGCQAGKLIFKAVLSMKGRDGEVMVRSILDEE